MGRQFSIFIFFALSTVAVIVMQPGPREFAAHELSTATEASRNELTVLTPEPQAAPLPVPDDVLSDIKAAAAQAQSANTFPVIQPDAAEEVALSAPVVPATPVAPQLDPVPRPSFLETVAPAPAAPLMPAPQQASAGPERAQLRDMSWSALGQLQQLGHVPQTPGKEGSLINSIVRRSMAHVDNPADVAPAPVLAAPAPMATPVAPAPRASASLTPAPAAVPATGPIGKRATYMVVPGDNLALIAVKLYGSALKTDQLLRDNPSLRANPNSLRIGQVISYRAQ